MCKFIIILLLILINPCVYAQQSTESQIEYQKIQTMRDEANELFSENANNKELKRAESLLLQTLKYARSKKVRAYYHENIYLEARQWDIIRDLIRVNIFQKDNEMVANYTFQLIENNQIIGIRDFTNLDNVLSDNIKYQNYIQKLDAWKRISKTDAFSSQYKENLNDTEKIEGLSIFWSEAKYSFVYFDQVPKLDWDKTYSQYIQKVLTTQNTQEYYQELMLFSGLLKDSHTNIYPPNEISDKFYSKPPLSTALIENKVIITDVYSQRISDMGLKSGDEIIKINDQDVFTYAKQNIKPYVGASTAQDLNVRLYNYMLLRGDKDKSIKLTIKCAKELGNMLNVCNKQKDITLQRSGYDDTVYPDRKKFKIINNIAYIVLNSFSSSNSYDNFIKHFPEIIQSKGLIIDVRNNGGGSSNWGYKVLAHLTQKPIITSKSKTRKYIATDRAWGNTQVQWHEYESYPVNYNFKNIYQGKVVVLTSAKTFSAAEDFVLAFKVNQLGSIIGSKTAGSTGQPLVFDLPGGGKARVCSKRDMYPDGSDWVGFGIPVDIKAHKTQLDYRNNTDTVLQKAIALLSQKF